MPNPTSPALSVVICTYNRRELVERAVRSLMVQTRPAESFEVILVDNNSKDDTFAWAQNFRTEFPSLRALRESNQGLNGEGSENALARDAMLATLAAKAPRPDGLGFTMKDAKELGAFGLRVATRARGQGARRVDGGRRSGVEDKHARSAGVVVPALRGAVSSADLREPPDARARPLVAP